MNNLTSASRTPVWLIILFNSWHAVEWCIIVGLLYFEIPAHSFILDDFDVEPPWIVSSLIGISNVIVVNIYLVPVFAMLFVAADFFTVYSLARKQSLQLLWMMIMSAVPFFALLYIAVGISAAFYTAAVQIALKNPNLQ